MNNRLLPVLAFVSLWGTMFACGGLAVHARAPMFLVVLALFACPLTYAGVSYLCSRIFRLSLKNKRPSSFLFFFNFFVSDVLQLLNPFALRFIIAQSLTPFFLRANSRRTNPIQLQLPFRGTWLVAAGGATRSTSHSWMILAQRYAYDFLIGTSLAHASTDHGVRLADYPAYGQPIFAPVDGLIVSLRKTIRDAPAPGSGWLDWWAMDPRGNYVLIQCQPDTYVLLAHLRPNSITVNLGQQVQAGAKIGECGNSGRSTEPHLHLHCQRGAGLAFATGIPIVFSACRVQPVSDEGSPNHGTLLERGMQVQSAIPDEHCSSVAPRDMGANEVTLQIVSDEGRM